MIDETLLEAAEKMDKAVEVAKEDFATIRTGRANPALFSKVMVDYYGAPTPLQQLASFPNPEPRTLLITPYDKAALHDIEKALRDSDLGANPSNDGKVIRVVLPELTQERRKEYVKVVRGKGEDAKVSIRNIRRKAKDAIDKLVKDGDVGEDEGARAEKELDANDQVAHRRHGRAAQAQGSRAARGLMSTDQPQPVAGGSPTPAAGPGRQPACPAGVRCSAAAKPSRAGRNLPAAIAVGLALMAVSWSGCSSCRCALVVVVAASSPSVVLGGFPRPAR